MTHPHPPALHRATRARRCAVWLAALLLAACGGGVGSGGTGSFASGPISGFGSIVVNGVHYDESSADVRDEDAQRVARDALRLGMTVEIEAGPVTPASGSEPARAVASRVRVASELVGPAEALDAAAQTLTVAGQPVLVNAATVIDDRLAGGLAAVTPGQVVEVYGFRDAAQGRVVATRLEPRPGAGAYKVRGLVSALDAATLSFAIEGQRFVLRQGLALPAGLADGQFVRVQLLPQRDAQGRWVVTGFGRALPEPGDREEMEIKGLITSFTSNASFAVNGVPVDARTAEIDGSLAPGVRVEVEGRFVGGVLVAREVEVESDDDAGRFQMEGHVLAVDDAARTFTLRRRAEVVSFAGDVVFEGGTAASLRPEVEVQVQGVLSADRTRVQATRIRIGGD